MHNPEGIKALVAGVLTECLAHLEATAHGPPLDGDLRERINMSLESLTAVAGDAEVVDVKARARELLAEIFGSMGRAYEVKAGCVRAGDYDQSRPFEIIVRALNARQAVEGMVLPAMNDDLRDILGRVCFQFIGIAKLMRAAGMEVNTRAEDEQAYGIHWLLTLYAKHGAGWREAAGAQLREWTALAAAAPQAGKGDAS